MRHSSTTRQTMFIIKRQIIRVRLVGGGRRIGSNSPCGGAVIVASSSKTGRAIGVRAVRRAAARGGHLLSYVWSIDNGVADSLNDAGFLYEIEVRWWLGPDDSLESR